MARPTKITEEKKLRLADFIRSGLTIKDSCEAVRISTSTFNRLRARDIEFDRLIVEATEGGWTNAEAFAKYHYRGYKRKNPIKLPPLPQTALTDPLKAPQNGFEDQHKVDGGQQQKQPKTYLGLPVRFTYPDSASGFFFNGNNGRVEKIHRDGTLQSMSADTWERKYLHPEEDFCFGWFF